MTSQSAHQPIFLPKLWSTARSYSLPLFWGDLTAGVIVGIVALPLAIAFAIASGVTPDRGLITAIVAGFLISALGGSRVQIGGPTGAFIVLVYSIVHQYGLNGLILCTFLAGIMLIGMGLARLGILIKLIPYPLTVGFTAGIAVVIAFTQVKDFLGLQTGPLPAEFLEKCSIYARTIRTINPTALLLSLLSLAILLLWPRVNRRIPGSIIAILAITALVHLLHIPVETIGSRFGEIPSTLPSPSLPQFSVAEVRHLLGPAFTVALLCAIESLLSATVADGMIEGRHRSNTELIGQGIANIASALFGGMPATGAIARTATNVRNGGRTPVAGMIHAAVLLLIVLLLGRWAALIPLCVLSAILMMVAYHMSEWHAFRSMLKAPKMDVAVLFTTFLLTIFVDLTVAVEAGLMMSVLLFMRRMMDVTTVRQVTSQLKEEEVDENALRSADDAVSRRQIPEGVEVYEAEGALFFGIAEMLRDNLTFGKNPPKAVIFRMRHVLALDASGIRALQDLRSRCSRMGTRFIIEGLHTQPLVALDRAGVLAEFGEKDVVATLDAAIKRAKEVLATSS
ncbi:MAG: SulP family inorganic anion transporter [Candidatus Omnitrophica bacterium]|nr:SulP family inorganic anion transporter [Candidatus Omnitrophota bacterium]